MTQTTKETADQDSVEQYILKELSYSAEWQTWFELNGQYAITLQDILTRKDAEIDRLREALEKVLSVQPIKGDEGSTDIIALAKALLEIDSIARAALKEKE